MSALICGKKFLSLTRSLIKVPRRTDTGYYVLVPEIGDDLHEKYPLLKEETMLPEFNQITIEKCIAAIARQTLDFEKEMKTIDKDLAEMDNINVFTDIFDKIEMLEGPLQLTWGISKTLFYGHETLMPNSSYLSINKRAHSAVVSKYFYPNIFKAIKKAEKETNLTDEQRRLLKKYILESEFAGMGLKQSKRDIIVNYSRKIDLKKDNFKSKVEIATKMFKRKIDDPSLMKGFPVDFLKAIAVEPSEYEVGPWIINLHPEIAKKFLEYCPDPMERYNVWQADVLRCSEYREPEFKNCNLVNQIPEDKRSLAECLGYKHYIEMSMSLKMVGSMENLQHFFDTLLAAAYPYQETEIEKLREFVYERSFDKNIEQWDLLYWIRKHKRFLYNYDEEMLRKYFPLTRVVINSFRLIRELFNVEIVERQKVQGWNRNVHFFDVFDPEVSMSEPVGSFYFDPFTANEEDLVYKNVNSVILLTNRSDICKLKPLSSLILTLKQPEKPEDDVLMNFYEVRHFIANMGHLLQQLLTKVERLDLAGLSFIEWDAIYITRHVMENWAYNPQFLKRITYDQETGGPLDDSTIQKIIDSRYYMPGYHLCKELYLSSLDVDIYSKPQGWEYLMEKAWKKHFVLPKYDKDSHICSWTKIFIEQNGGCYYGDLWSKMVAADIYSAFEECADDPKSEQVICKRFKDTYLSLGGSVSAQEVFRRFRGRDPNYNALLKSMKLK